jgi:IPT/TIG domain-containing protein
MATNVADAANQSELKLLLITSGPYIAQNLILTDDLAASALADGWGVDYHDADFDPYNVPFGSGSSEGLPQSYEDFLTAIDPSETPEPPEPPEPDVAPTLDTLSPSTAELGSADFTLHLLGADFTPSSVIMFAGQPEPIVFVSDEEITTVVKPSLGWGAVSVPVLVKNGVEESASLDFTFTEAPEE